MRRFLDTYTPGHIKAEIALRLAAWKKRNVSRREATPAPAAPYDDRHAASVGRFYDRHHDQFMEVYGEVIQALRTRNVVDLLNYEIRSIGFEPGQRALDAGCGTAAPAAHFVRCAKVRVDGITISNAQYQAARRRVDVEGLHERLRVVCGDYHRLTDYFASGAYDVVYFLESFGHSRDKSRLVDACWDVLRPGGCLYIKDLFARVPPRPEHRGAIDREIRRINSAYCYEIGDLNAVLDVVRRKGFVLSLLKTVDLPLDGFEDLAISNRFQELTGIARIENWDDYVFPVDFFELRCVKPVFGVEDRLDRWSLQNLYHLAAPPAPAQDARRAVSTAPTTRSTSRSSSAGPIGRLAVSLPMRMATGHSSGRHPKRSRYAGCSGTLG